MIFKSLLVLILSLSFWLTPQSPLAALTCQKTFTQDVSSQPICLLQIKRSAKNYWEYRATLKIGDRPKLTRVYNCRQHYYWQTGRDQVFKKNYPKQDPLANYVCSLYKKS